jgi:isovaleryl-CoA dehydrogenase
LHREHDAQNCAARLLRGAKLSRIGAGTSEIRRMLIGRELFEGNE